MWMWITGTIGRWIIAGLITGVLLGSGYLAYRHYKVVKAENIALQAENKKLKDVIRIERKAKDEADRLYNASPEEILEFWRKKERSNQPMDNSELKKKIRVWT